MLMTKARTVDPSAWVLLGLILGVSIGLAILGRSDVIIPTQLSYTVQPMLSVGLAIISASLIHRTSGRVRHKGEKSIIIASVIAIWFVIYFLSGFLLTYVKNSLAVDVQGVLMNLLAFGVSAGSIEFVRYKVMQAGGRRNFVWFGAIVTIVFSMQQISLVSLSDIATPEDWIKTIVSDIVPILVGNLLLTYLAVTAGLSAQLVYRLGVLAIMFIPPIIPKFDWYLLGVSWLLLAVAIYIALDKSQQGTNTEPRNYYRHVKRSHDVMWFVLMIALISFMTGIFTYKPSAIMSNSMKPVFSRGDMIIMQKVGPKTIIQVGDIIQYQKSGNMITHRVTAVDSADDGSGKRIYITKGDNSPSKDPAVQENQIVGIVRSRIPFIGYPTVMLREMVQ